MLLYVNNIFVSIYLLLYILMPMIHTYIDKHVQNMYEQKEKAKKNSFDATDQCRNE